MSTIRTTLLKRAPAGFVDPITRLPPVDECSLSALLCFYHHTGNIDWNQVSLRSLAYPALDGEIAASVILEQPGFLGCEYPLFWKSQQELEERGGMRPDLLFLSDDQSTIAIIENKIGAADTHKGDKYGGQLGRYIKFLLDNDIEQRYMVLLTSTEYLTETRPWYIPELRQAEKNIKGASEKVHIAVIVWEDVYKALTYR